MNHPFLKFRMELYSHIRDLERTCELFSDSSATRFVPYEKSNKANNILYQIFGMPFNVTSGYCHKPNITILMTDVDDQDSNYIDTWSSFKKGK